MRTHRDMGLAWISTATIGMKMTTQCIGNEDPVVLKLVATKSMSQSQAAHRAVTSRLSGRKRHGSRSMNW